MQESHTDQQIILDRSSNDMLMVSELTPITREELVTMLRCAENELEQCRRNLADYDDLMAYKADRDIKEANANTQAQVVNAEAPVAEVITNEIPQVETPVPQEVHQYVQEPQVTAVPEMPAIDESTPVIQ